jgi:hypothetical protein
MASQKQSRRATDTLLLSIWIFAYYALLRCFRALQRIETLLAGSKRAGT